MLIAFLFAAVLALPIWYFTTRVERATLPHAAIESAFRAKAHDEALRVALNVVVVGATKLQQCKFDTAMLQRTVDSR